MDIHHEIDRFQAQVNAILFQSSVDGSTLVSGVVLVPSISDVGSELECRVDTPGLDQVLQHKWKLPIQCRLQQSNMCISIIIIYPTVKAIANILLSIKSDQTTCL